MRATTVALLAVSMTLVLGACATPNGDMKLSDADREKRLQQVEDDRLSAAQHRQRESNMTSRTNEAVKASDQKAQVGRPQ